MRYLRANIFPSTVDTLTPTPTHLRHHSGMSKEKEVYFLLHKLNAKLLCPETIRFIFNRNMHFFPNLQSLYPKCQLLYHNICPFFFQKTYCDGVIAPHKILGLITHFNYKLTLSKPRLSIRFIDNTST